MGLRELFGGMSGVISVGFVLGGGNFQELIFHEETSIRNGRGVHPDLLAELQVSECISHDLVHAG